MSSVSNLSTYLDEDMLLTGGISIASSTTPDSVLTSNFFKTGKDVARELGGRLLLRYLLPTQVGVFTGGSPQRHFVTPTPYAPDETVRCLALPSPAHKREYVILLRPEKIDVILGPRWIQFGVGIEYILPNGFPPDALALPWEVQID